MKIANSASPLIVSANLDNNASIMGMSQEAALQMARHLRDTIYTDKILAVVRELVSNSNDEHIKFNVEKNVEIGIRCIENDYEFFSRDFAKGLSEEGIRTVFGVYGNSTKTSENNTVGAYGCGSKSPFSYSETYYVISHFGGLKTVYTCALGGDDKGSSNGFIYKTHSEPSNETGLEVVVPVKYSDTHKFSTEIRNFVYFSPHNIEADILCAKVVPLPIAKKEIIDNIEFTLFEGGMTKNTQAILQMGGVRYENIPLPEGFMAKEDHTLVVNVPIGSMTVALSRESFHDTPSNQNYKSKIKTILDELTQKDFEHIKSKPLKEIIEENIGELGIYKMFQSSMFQAKYSAIFKNTWDFVGGMFVANQKDDKKHNFVIKNGKPVLVLIPDNSASDYWISKVKNFAKANNESYYCGHIRNFNKMHPNGIIEVSEIFNVMGAKSLKYPKLKKAKTYAVYLKDRKRGSVNAIGFVNMVREVSFSLPEETDEAKLAEWIAEEKKKAIESKDAQKMIKLAITVGGKSRYSAWTCQSEELAQQVEALGFFIGGRGEYSKLTIQWEQERQAEAKIRSKITSALKPWIVFSPQTPILVKKVRNAERLNKFWNAIFEEKTTRNKIFKSLREAYDSYSTSKTKLTREEVRAVMKLK